MALTLRNAITATQTTFDVTGTDALESGDLRALGDEKILIRTAKQATTGYGETASYRVSCYRGALGTVEVAHDAGTTLDEVTIGSGASAHAASHEDGGADEIDVTGLVGALPTGWTQDPETGAVDAGGQDFTNVSVTGTFVGDVTGNISNGTQSLNSEGLDTGGAAIQSGGGDIDSGGGSIGTAGGDVATTGGDVNTGNGGRVRTDGVIARAAALNIGEAANTVGFFEAAGTSQQTLARPAGDAGDLWDILNAYGLVVAP